MAYVKPGVEVTQVSRSLSPALSAPALEACLVGYGYWWQDPNWANDDDSLRNSVWRTVSGVYIPYSGIVITNITFSGINATYNDIPTNAKELTVVQLLGTSGDDAGAIKHLEYGTDFSTDGTTITVSGNSAYRAGTYMIRVGFLAKKDDTFGFQAISNVNEIDEIIGTPVSWNALAFGTKLAINNSNTQINVFSYEDTGSGTSVDIENLAISDLGSQDVYAIAPMYELDPSNLDVWTEHVNTYSAPEYKKERIAILNTSIPWDAGQSPFYNSSTYKNDTIDAIAGQVSSVLDRRTIYTYPDAGYITETRPVATVYSSWIKNSMDLYSSTTVGYLESGGKLYAKLLSDVTVGTKKYKAGIDLTDTILDEMVAGGWGQGSGNVTVKVPVLGFYYTAVVAGQVVGLPPEQPLTNLPIGGISDTLASSDYFNELELNSIAQNGAYIMYKSSTTAPVVCRHQLTTDITTIEKREVSIIKTVDYVAKFIRKAVSPFIGRYTITPAFLDLVSNYLKSIKETLIAKGTIIDLAVGSIVQDQLNPDTVKIEVSLKVKYPVNYIKITLVF